VHTLGPDDLALFEQARTAYRARIKADCTACRYCLPCSAGVDIPGVLAALNDVTLYDDPASSRWLYNAVAGKASLCEECADCEALCPQDLPIRRLLEEARTIFRE
jgi:predicted aldo/keto reductase-like oxidoreductase